jgi:CzcA family heavy metal efflux pump
MRGIIGVSLRFQFLVITIAVVIIAFGITQLSEMPVDILPEFSVPYVEIQTEALGLSAKEMEQMITVPMEQDLLAGVAWLDVVRSETVPGLSSVLIYFEPGTDLYKARQMVAERLAQAAVGLPNVSKPPTMMQPLSSASRFMIVGLSSDELSLIDMSVLARWTIAPRLMGVPGVASVAIWGQRDRQLQVLVDPERLMNQDISLEQVIQTTGNALWVSPLSYLEASSPGTGGFIDTPNQRLVLWHVLPISSPEDLARVPIEGANGLTLGDVAEVAEDHQLLIGDAVINDNPNLLLVIEKLPEINILEVTQGLESALDALQPGLPGMEFDATLFRPATFIEMAITNLTRTLLIAAVLMVVIMGAFLYNWRTALISLVVIFISLVTTLVVLYLRGSSINVMVLAGLVIAFGVIVDDGIVDIEHIVRRLRQNHQEGSPKSVERVIQDALAETRYAIFFATMIILLALLPVFFMEGISGALMQPMVISYALAVLAGMVVALTLTPALSLFLLSNTRSVEHEFPLIPVLQRGYERTLARIIKNPSLAGGAIIILAVIGIIAVPFIKQDQLLPLFQEPYLTIQIESAPATSLPEMNRIISRISSEIRTIPGVQNIGSHIGRAVFGDQVVGINSAELWVSLDPNADDKEIANTVQEVIEGYPGVSSIAGTYLQQILKQSQMYTTEGITLRVYGDDLEILSQEAEKLRQNITGINGIDDLYISLPTEEPTLEIEVDLNVAQKYGIKPGDVRRTVATLISGLVVGSLFEEQKVFDVVVWGVPEIRDSITKIKDLLIQTPDGGRVRLGEVADVSIVASPNVIRHESVSPYLDINIIVKGRNTNDVIRDINDIVKNVSFPLEYHAEVISDYVAQQEIQQHILLAGIVAIIGIFLLLQAFSKSWRLALVVFMTMLAALGGGMLAVLLSNGAFSLISLFGLFAVLGIGVRNSIMLINYYQYLEVEEGCSFGKELVLRGSKEQIAPILLTTLTTGLVLLVFVIFGNISGQEIIYQLAIVILSGLVTSTLLNLFALPALYLRFGPSREPDLGLNGDI